MTYLALDKDTNDLILKDGGGLERVTDGRFVVQQVQCNLQIMLGEWLLDKKVGWVSLEDFERNFDQLGIENRARKVILETQGVLEIISLEARYNRERRLDLDFKARTIYGEISLTVPWGGL